MPAQTVIKLRRGTASQWTTANPVLASGEMGVETDTNKFKFGDGATAWTSLAYGVAAASGGTSVEWTDVLNKPSVFPPDTHTHLLADITDVTATATELNYVDGVTSAIQTQLDGKAASTHTHLIADVTDFDPATKQDVVAGVSSTEIGYLDGVTSAIQTQLDDKAASTHTHLIADVTDFDPATKQDVVAGVSSTEIGYLDGVTSAIQTQLDGKAATSHSHTISDVTNLQTTLDGKAPLTPAVNAKTANYTLVADDRGEFITCDGTFTITIPSATFSAGDRVDFVNIGTGVITFAGSGVTVSSVGSAVTIDTQYAGATFFFTSPTAGVLIGKLA